MGFFDKIKAGLTKTRDALSDSLSGLFSGGTEIDDVVPIIDWRARICCDHDPFLRWAID